MPSATPASATPSAHYAWPTCNACGHDLHTAELGHVACRICRDRTDHNLTALAGPDGLYAQLGHCLTPSAATRDGSRTPKSHAAPLPLRLEPLSLTARGGIITILQTWLVDWHETLGWNHPRWQGNLQQQLDQVVTALRNNLDWAAAHHPAFAEFAHEVADLTRACRRQTTGEKPERRIAVACPCGTTLHITVSTPGARCRGCGTQYDRAAALDLPLATRAAA